MICVPEISPTAIRTLFSRTRMRARLLNLNVWDLSKMNDLLAKCSGPLVRNCLFGDVDNSYDTIY